MNDKLIIAGKEFSSRLFLGSGKFPCNNTMKQAIEASCCDIVTLALRRIDFNSPDENMSDFIDQDKQLILTNTSGAKNAKEAILLAKLAQEANLPSWIKLEIHPDPRYLLPDPVETLIAAEELVKLGFVVFPYINADPVLAKRLEEVGCATVMPLAAPIGTNLGITNQKMLEIIIEQSNVPVVIDAGLGMPSHACQAMEMGASALLVNTAISTASDPVMMAKLFKDACITGRNAYLLGKNKTFSTAQATSPLTSFLND